MLQNSPKQYTKLGNLIKRFLHTKIGAKIGYYAGISGFNRLEATVSRLEGYDHNGDPIFREKKKIFSFNSRVDKGGALTASLLTGTSLGSITTPLPPLYIALSTSTLTPAKTDTTLTGETVVAGVARALGTVGSYVAPSTLDGAASYVLSKTFTLTGAATTIVSSGIFDAVSVGNMFVEANLSSSAVLSTGDQLTIQWTINL